MQTLTSLVCAVVVLVLAVGYTIVYPSSAAMLVCVVLAYVLVTVGYDALIARLTASQHPAARRLASLHATVVGLLRGDPPYDGPERKLARGVVRTVVYSVAIVIVFALLLWFGDALDRLFGVEPKK